MWLAVRRRSPGAGHRSAILVMLATLFCGNVLPLMLFGLGTSLFDDDRYSIVTFVVWPWTMEYVFMSLATAGINWRAAMHVAPLVGAVAGTSLLLFVLNLRSIGEELASRAERLDRQPSD